MHAFSGKKGKRNFRITTPSHILYEQNVLDSFEKDIPKAVFFFYRPVNHELFHSIDSITPSGWQFSHL